MLHFHLFSPTKGAKPQLGPLSLWERVRVRTGFGKLLGSPQSRRKALTPNPSPKGRGEVLKTRSQIRQGSRKDSDRSRLAALSPGNSFFTGS